MNKILPALGVVVLLILLIFAQTAHSGTRNDLVDKVSHVYTPPAFNDNFYFEWNALKKEVLETNAKTVVIHVTGTGGEVPIGREVIDAVEEAKSQGKEVIMHVHRYAASMHFSILCHADKVAYDKDSIVLIHAVVTISKRGVVTLKGYDIAATKELLRPCVEKGILTEAEMYRTLAGYNLIRIYTGGQNYTAIEKARNLKME